MRILITGAQGQLGSELRERLGTLAHLQSTFVSRKELDLSSEDSIEKFFASESPFDLIINCAAYTAVDKAESDSQTAYRINHWAVEQLAKIARKQDATLMHISTDYVFDGAANRPYGEDGHCNPISVYGKSKVAGEKALVESGAKYIIIRTAWLYSLKYGSNFVQTMKNLTANKDAINVVYDQVGCPTNAACLAEAIVHIIESNQTQKTGIYHYSCEGVCSWYDFAIAIRNLYGNKCQINPCLSDQFPSPVKRPAYSVFNKSKFRQTFGIEIPHWQEALCSK